MMLAAMKNDSGGFAKSAQPMKACYSDFTVPRAWRSAVPNTIMALFGVKRCYLVHFVRESSRVFILTNFVHGNGHIAH